MRFFKWIGIVLLLGILGIQVIGCEQADPSTNSIGGLLDDKK